MGVFGDTLRQARAQKGVTLKEAEQATRINRHHLAALEEENFAVLPVGLVYQRGSIRNYATFLDLDPGKLLPMFEEARGGDTSVEWVTQVKPLEMPNHWTPNFAIIAFMVVMSAIVFTWVYSISFNNPVVSATLPPVIPTVTPIPEDRLALPEPTAIPPTVVVTSDQAVVAASGEPIGFQPALSTPPPVQNTAVAPTATPLPLTAAAPTEVSQQVVAEQPQAAPVNGATIRVIAQGDIDLTILADGNPVFSGWLGAGNSTDWFTAGSFEVSTSDGALTQFENADTGQQFFMGFGSNETYQLGN